MAYTNQCRVRAQVAYEMNEQVLNNQDAPNDLTGELSDEALNHTPVRAASCILPPN